jgi:hypothetical protein
MLTQKFQENVNMSKGGCQGFIEFITKDRNGKILDRWCERNIVRIFSKEQLAHLLPSTQVWDPTANSGAGGWIANKVNPDNEFSARYILFGASFDATGSPVDNDPRYYQKDTATGTYVPIRLGPGAEYNGELINAIPISEPNRPLKRVEKISFSPTYQPSGLPLLQDDVRAINNIVQLQTTLQLNEYNGFGTTGNDYFVITEVALAGGRTIDSVGTCELTPRKLFLEGPVNCQVEGSDTLSIPVSETQVDLIVEGDQVMIAAPDGSVGPLNQVSPYYLVLSKAIGGRNIQLDRTPVDSSNNPIIGPVLVYRDTLRLFSARVLSVPFRKSCLFMIDIIWTIILN